MMEFPIGVGGYKTSGLAKIYVNEVLESGRLSYGPFTRAFEQRFANLHGCRHAVFMNSGTDALRIALNTLKTAYGWKEGYEVIVPAVTFVATANIVRQNNMTPVFVDIDPSTYNIDPDKIENAITAKTVAIIPVHLMGLPCDMERIVEISKKYGLRIIEDSCETMFGSVNKQMVGSIGDMGCFSTYMAHFIVTGVGGLVTTNDDEYARTVRSYMNHARNPKYLSIDDDNDREAKDFLDIVKSRFDFWDAGYSSRATEMEAALGLAQLEEKDFIIERRQKIAKFYDNNLIEFSNRIQRPLHTTSYTQNMYMLYPIVMKKESSDAIVAHLEKNGIETRPLMPLLKSKAYAHFIGDFPVADWLAKSGFYIGCHQYITDEQAQYVVDKIREFFS